MKSKLMRGLFIWWLIAVAMCGAILATGGVNYMPGPLQEGQDRPTY